MISITPYRISTGGTSINGILANKFERVCGNKGFSYDAYQDNERARGVLLEKGRVGTGPKGSRGRVRVGTMDEIGYEDCDYISREANWKFWIDRFGKGKFYGLEMELHVPCRDSIDHLMSECNFHHQYQIDCEATSLETEIDKCVGHLERFDMKLLDQFSVKCYDFKKQFTVYTDYMSKILQPRRIESKTYVKRDTNRARNKTNECVWSQPKLMAQVEKYLLENDYYAFCNECMGSEDEITLEDNS